jgi:hypothetical protein
MQLLSSQPRAAQEGKKMGRRNERNKQSRGDAQAPRTIACGEHAMWMKSMELEGAGRIRFPAGLPEREREREREKG